MRVIIIGHSQSFEEELFVVLSRSIGYVPKSGAIQVWWLKR